MPSAAIFRRDFESLADTDTVGAAMRLMLSASVADLPVVDRSGMLVGMLKLDRILAALLPRAALIGSGIPDLSFVSDSLDHLRQRMHEIEDDAVSHLMVKAEHVIHPDTPSIEIVLLLYKGARNIPVVDRDTGKLVGMVAARDILEALHSGAPS